MSDTTVLTKPSAKTALPCFWRVTTDSRRLWRVWDILEQSEVPYTGHGVFGWDWFPQRMVLVELHGTAQDIAQVVNDFEMYRFPAVAVESIESAFPGELAGGFPVESEQPVADALPPAPPTSAFS